MSNKVQSLVWEHYPEGGSKLLVLIKLADYSNDDGANVFPSVQTVANMCRLSVRQAQYVLHELVADGVLIANGSTKGGRNKATKYSINIPMLLTMRPELKAQREDMEKDKTVQPIAPIKTVQPIAPLEVKGAIQRNKGCNTASKTVQPIAHDPTYNHQEKETTLAAHDKSRSADKPKITFDFDTAKFGPHELMAQRVELWRDAYPAVNVMQEIKQAAAWLIANPKNRKSNYEKFLTNWFSRAQDKAPRATQGKSTVVPGGWI